MTEKTKKWKIPYDEEDLINANNNIFNPFPKVWDPSSTISEEIVRKHCSTLEAQYIYLSKNYESFKKKIKKSLLIGKIGFGISFILIFFIEVFPSLFILSFFWMYYFSIIGSLQKLAINLIKLQIAKIKNWIYDPEENKSMYNFLRKEQSELFSVGDSEHKIYDQFWGHIIFEEKTYWFYLANFHYVEISNDSKKKLIHTINILSPFIYQKK